MNTIRPLKRGWIPWVRFDMDTESSLEQRFEVIAGFIAVVQHSASISHMSAVADADTFPTPFDLRLAESLWRTPQDVASKGGLSALGKKPSEFTINASWERDYRAEYDYFAVYYDEPRFQPQLWASVWLKLIERARGSIRLAHAVAWRRDQEKAGCACLPSYTNQHGLIGLGWLNYFGPQYASVLPKQLYDACVDCGDVRHERFSDGSQILILPGSIRDNYWDHESHRVLSRILAPLMLPRGVQGCVHARLLPAMDFSEMRSGYERVSELLPANEEYAQRLLCLADSDSTPLALLIKSFEVSPPVQPEYMKLARFYYNAKIIARAFRKARLRPGEMQFSLAGLSRMPGLVSGLKIAARSNAEEREALIGLAACIGECYHELHGRWSVYETSPVVRYFYEERRIKYAFPFLEAKRLWEAAGVK